MNFAKEAFNGFPKAELFVTKDCKRLTADTFLPAMESFFPVDERIDMEKYFH